MQCIPYHTLTPQERWRILRPKMTSEEVNSAFPIVGYTIVNGGIILHRECALDSLKDMRTGRRQRVTNISPRSLSRLALLASENSQKFHSMITLTYGQNYPLDGTRVKYHLNYFLTKLKRSYGPFDYLWFLEFQKRGAPHFHILTSLAGPTRLQRLKMGKEWANIIEPHSWPYERVVWAGGEACYLGEYQTNDAVVSVHSHKSVWDKIHRHNGAAHYVVKYATKIHQKDVPRAYKNVGRFWGKAGG